MIDRLANRWPYILALLAAVSMLGCGGDRIVIEPRFAQAAQMFSAATGMPITTSIRSNEAVPLPLGGYYDPDTNTVWVGTDIEGELLNVIVWHELGHCVLDRPHIAGKLVEAHISEESIFYVQWSLMVSEIEFASIASALRVMPYLSTYYLCELMYGHSWCEPLLHGNTSTM